MKQKEILYVVVGLLVIFVLIKSYREGFTGINDLFTSLLNTVSATDIAVQDMSSKLTKLETDYATIGELQQNNIFPDNIQINETTLDGWNLRKTLSQNNIAGIATTMGVTSVPLFEGYHELQDVRGLNDTWDDIYLYRGWKITLYEHANKGGVSYTLSNPSNRIVYLKLDTVGLGKNVTAYDAIWIDWDTKQAAPHTFFGTPP